MAWAFFGYSIYSLGLPLVAFFAILQMFSWSIGLAMSGMIMRVGQSAESFAWAAVFILMPVSGVYYPVSVLPHWLQVISWGLPPAYVFEGMRAILAEKTVHWDMLAHRLRAVGRLPRHRLPDLPVVLPTVAPRRHLAGAGSNRHSLAETKVSGCARRGILASMQKHQLYTNRPQSRLRRCHHPRGQAGRGGHSRHHPRRHGGAHHGRAWRSSCSCPTGRRPTRRCSSSSSFMSTRQAGRRTRRPHISRRRSRDCCRA